MHVINHNLTSSEVNPGTPALWQQVRLFLSTRHENGQSLVEFAVCLPILLLVMTGIMTFGIALNNYLMMTNAVNIGAQVLAVDRGNTSDPCKDAAKAISNASPNLTSSSLNFSFVLNGNSYPSTGTYAGLSASTCTSGVADLVSGKAAQVTVTYPCNLSVYGHNFAPSCNLQAQTTEIVQ